MSWAELMTLGVLSLDEGRYAAAALCFGDALLVSYAAAQADPDQTRAHRPRLHEARRHLEDALARLGRSPEGAARAESLLGELWTGLQEGRVPAAADLPADPRGAPPVSEPPPRPPAPPRHPTRPRPPPRETWSGLMEGGVEYLSRGQRAEAARWFHRAWRIAEGFPEGDPRREDTRRYLAEAAWLELV